MSPAASFRRSDREPSREARSISSAALHGSTPCASARSSWNRRRRTRTPARRRPAQLRGTPDTPVRDATWLMSPQIEGRSATARRPPAGPRHLDAPPGARHQRPHADLPAPPQTSHVTAATQPARPPRRADNGRKCRHRAAAPRAPHTMLRSRRLPRRLGSRRRDVRAGRVGPRCRRHRWRRLWRRQFADRRPHRDPCVL
jgi:hypothetical protein